MVEKNVLVAARDHLGGALDVEHPVATVEHLQGVVVEPVLALVVYEARLRLISATSGAVAAKASTVVR